MESYDICVIAVKEDKQIADRLAESIRRYRMPSGVHISDPRLDYRRIRTEIADKAIDKNARELLEHSRYLVIMCSPDTKDNAAIYERLSLFRELHNGERIVAVIVRGEPADAFPEGFIEQKLVKHILPDMSVEERIETIEPIAADLRADTEKRRRQLLRYETVRIVASVLNLHPDELEQRHRARVRRRIAAAFTLIASVCLIAAGIFLHLGLIAKEEGDIATKQTQLSLQIAARTISQLPERFEESPEALVYIEEAISNAKSVMESLDASDPSDPSLDGKENAS